MAFDITPYIDMKPAEVRKLIREGVIDFPTAGMCRGYAQANLIILPPEYAADFEKFAELNPFPCPILEIIKGEQPLTHAMGEGGNICSDIPRYRIYRDGVWDGETLTDVTEYWKQGYVGFLIGCSFSFEEALMKEGIEVRHIAQGRNVPMYKVGIQTVKAGPFEGPMVCSMRPMTPENAQKAYDITVKPLTDAWGFGRNSATTTPNVDSLIEFVGYDRIAIDGNRLVKDDRRTQIDLNSIAKGYTVDLVAERLEAMGVVDYMVNIGGVGLDARVCEIVNRKKGQGKVEV